MARCGPALLGVLVAACISACTRSGDDATPSEQPVVESPVAPAPRPPPPVVTSWTLESGQTLGQVLTAADLPATRQLVSEVGRLFDPRHLPPGTRITATGSGGVDSRSLHVILDDVIITAAFTDGTWVARLDSVRVRTDTVVVGAVLDAGESVLTAADRVIASLPPTDRAVLIAELVELYREDVDFRRDMQPGDRFAVMATRRVRPNGTVRDHQILATEITIRRTAHYRVFFSHPQGAGYFTPDGGAVRVSLTRFPIRAPRITSSFNPSRRHPVLGIVRPHLGLDLHAPPGTPVLAIGDGRVTRAGRAGTYGTAVFLDHGRGTSTRYAHLARLAEGIVPGYRVQRGDVIGYSGATGNVAGPHLHYELLINGRPVDPAATRLPTDEPVGPDAIAAFAVVVRERLPLVQGVVGTNGPGSGPTSIAPVGSGADSQIGSSRE